ncbi:MAG: hypothetical protein Q9O24_06900 [Gammaproteobacteria bacterium]|nr:hypothetical protein [Gammaproteobacteria bacterium]
MLFKITRNVTDLLTNTAPSQCHNVKDSDILEQRKAIYEAAKERNPTRWSGNIRDWSPISEVWLNPPKEMRAEEQKLPKEALGKPDKFVDKN